MTYEDGANLIFAHIDYQVLSTIAEIELVIQTMTMSGASAEAIREYLLSDLLIGGRIFGAFASGVATTTSIGITSSAQIAQMLEYKRSGVRVFKWVTVSKNPCRDCAERAGEVEEWAVWELIGVPRSGFSVCRGNCKCHLEPSGYLGDDTIILE
tara:strand:- start:3881 stop:4342 length:462 start_codon:yes stop_codon:yes gene_type:complete